MTNNLLNLTQFIKLDSWHLYFHLKRWLWSFCHKYFCRIPINYLLTTAYVKPTIKDNLIVPIHSRTIVVFFVLFYLYFCLFYLLKPMTVFHVYVYFFFISHVIAFAFAINFFSCLSLTWTKVNSRNNLYAQNVLYLIFEMKKKKIRLCYFQSIW